ncbi:MAG: peptide chain release factor N(5)-glutamine methyltransferase [Halorhodospira halophila]|uniref:peptide chain release factor N(5)-glutamine methyltransferase n=1 Tax=Halorhodospira TaxID=85108 RepID=UPI0019149E91|nr:peptide chain release factor N(5)-glutamine methyltransferase [Halorhodospira halophila]MCG5540677.1 peptide chain release factor N(5)-glutamine methyltransferase [Halorhodospira sp. M39old]MCG5542756.1 peptide chain release factor N(5)-glutamine methyltransferase [Halorhodospira sp. 9628]MCG5545996.1 peptide chain release factor N(5)-glutamine methyltransferase [Halorhodospira sp. M38]MCC3751049.1 peptide chain release factor N(5)-glutamine methyltransferase [Halorhodospira halophila]MCG55
MSEAGRSIGQALREGIDALRASSASARLDAELLLAEVLGVGRSHLFAFPERPVPTATIDAYRNLLTRRAAGEPAAYLLRRCEFRDLSLTVTPAVLVPRPETEHLVEQALACLPAGGSLLELGTGSGAVALAVASERPDARITATERSEAALAVARENRQRLGLTSVELIAGDWDEGVPAGPFQVIASNPPYVETTAPEWTNGGLGHEPREALAAGCDGLAAIRSLLAPAAGELARGGWLMLEHGAAQGEAVRGLFAAAGLEQVRTERDLAGLERLTLGRRP